MRSVYFNYVVYFYIFTTYFYLFIPILNIFMHIPNYFHVYLYLYLTYLDIFSCIFIPIFIKICFHTISSSVIGQYKSRDKLQVFSLVGIICTLKQGTFDICTQSTLNWVHFGYKM